MIEQESSNHQLLTEMVNRFLAWPLPQSVCADLCATDSNYRFPRSGTNLLNVYEATSMLEHATAPTLAEIERLTREDELHWKTRRTLLSERGNLRAELDYFKSEASGQVESLDRENTRLRAALERAEAKLLRAGYLCCGECGAWLTTAMIGWHRCNEAAPPAETKA